MGDEDDLAAFYAAVRETLLTKPPADVAHELPGLVEHITDRDPETDHYVVGVSFSKNHTCLDYAVERVHVTEGDDPYVETVKTPASGSHRYVQFAHPPDPHFDDSALRSAILTAVDAEYRTLTDVDDVDGIAAVWEQL